MVNIKQFYKELGKLLYAVAKSDGKIQPKEIKVLHEFVLKELALFEPTIDSSGMNQAFYADFEFEKYFQLNISIDEAHSSFIKFLEENIDHIDPVLITKTIQAIEKVAKSFRSINKKEQAMINKIKTEITQVADLF